MHVAEEAIESEVNPENDSDTFEPEAVESLNREETHQAIFAMLFASDRPLSAGRIAEALGDADPDIVATLLAELKEEIDNGAAPIELREIAGGYQLTTEARYAPFIRRLFQIKKSNKLTKTVLETLAIIAYRQPVTRPDVESIRGVSVSHAFSQLQERRLIKAVGVSDSPGRPRLFRTTEEFLVHFGIGHLNELPSIDEFQSLR